MSAPASARKVRNLAALLGREFQLRRLEIDVGACGRWRTERATLAGLSFGITDIRAPESKTRILDEGQKKADKIEKNYRMGAITNEERKAQLIDLWGHARKQVTEDLMAGLAEASDANYYYVKDTEELPEIFAKELGELVTVAARDIRSACRSVLATMNSMCSIPESIMRLTALLPPPPTPITLMRASLRNSSLKLMRRPLSLSFSLSFFIVSTS